MSRAAAAIAIAICLLLVTPPAFAQETAEGLFRKGRDAAKRGDDAAACAFFNDSRALDPAAGTTLNLAMCLERLGRVASAWALYEGLQIELPTGDPRSQHVVESLKALAPRLPRLRLVPPDAVPASFRVQRDGDEVPLASLGEAVAVDPGRHEIRVIATGHLDRRFDVILQESEQRDLALDVGAATPRKSSAAGRTSQAVGSPPSKQSSAPSREPSRTLGWVVLASGVTALVTSAVAGAVVLDRKAAVDDGCERVGAEQLCSADAASAADAGRVWSTVATIAFGAGLAGTAAGAYLLATARPVVSSQAGLVTFSARF